MQRAGELHDVECSSYEGFACDCRYERVNEALMLVKDQAPEALAPKPECELTLTAVCIILGAILVVMLGCVVVQAMTILYREDDNLRLRQTIEVMQQNQWLGFEGQ